MEAQEGANPMPMVALAPPAPLEHCRVSQVSMPTSRQSPMVQEPPQMPKEMAADAQPVHPELCRVSPIQIPTSQCLPMTVPVGQNCQITQESPPIGQTRTGNSTRMFKRCAQEMEEGSVGEAEEEEESGELMFGDESGGEEDWDDGSDESDG
jgi:hypothetical protein